MRNDIAALWGLDPDVDFLNHGSYGACPKPVLEHQQLLRDVLETEPVRFFKREYEPRLDAALDAVGAFVGVAADDIAFVTNATTGVNAVLRSIELEPGDEVLVTDHAYGACRNALDYVAGRTGAKVTVAQIEFPPRNGDQVVTTLVDLVSDRTRLALVDHVTSTTALVMPIVEIVAALAERGVETLVDGAHAPGMVDLDLSRIGAGYYTGNCHKWLCAPKGAAILHVRPDLQESIVPTVISHGATAELHGRSRFRALFDWVGTDDPTAALSVPEAIRVLGELLPGGWPALREHNRVMARRGAEIVAASLGGVDLAPEEMTGSIVSIPLPAGPPKHRGIHPLEDRLLDIHRIEVPIVDGPEPGQRLVRVSAQAYNTIDQYERLAAALVTELENERD